MKDARSRPELRASTPMRRDEAGSRRPTLSGAAKAWLVALSLLLAVPTLAVRLQSRDALESFHNRVLARWPAARTFGRDPADYVARANRWLADRAYPIIAATHLANNLAYFALDASPKANISVGRDGFVFLNGSDPTSVNDLVENACAAPLDPSHRARLRAALDRIAAFGRRRALPIDVILVPTAPMLYPDRLPRAIPSRLREACAAGRAGLSPFVGLRPPEGLTFHYPYAAMSALRGDPAMFPNGNFHPDGLSVQVVRDVYLGGIGAGRPAGETVTPTRGPSELLGSHGIHVDFPLYDVSPSAGAVDEAATEAVRAATARFYPEPQTVFASRNAEAPNPITLLMLSDSYGDKEAYSFSAAFRTTVQMRPPDHDAAGLIDAVASLMRVDRLVLLFNDSNSESLVDLGDALQATADH